jgi:hypothetical protein
MSDNFKEYWEVYFHNGYDDVIYPYDSEDEAFKNALIYAEENPESDVSIHHVKVIAVVEREYSIKRLDVASADIKKGKVK